MNLPKVLLLFRTLKFLKWKQIYFRVYYKLRKVVFNPSFDKKLSLEPKPLVWGNDISFSASWFGNGTFELLNIRHQFKEAIDWNYNSYGKLWTYNLNYFDFLNQAEIAPENGLRLIQGYIQHDKNLLDGKEPYPISLRGINWIKFLSKNNISDQKVNQCLYNHYQVLAHNLEYHLLGNHLLENGFSLLFGAYYFKEDTFYKKARIIITNELKEQVLNDGAHFELSPMYHQIILHRLLDCINLIRHNGWKEDVVLSSFLKNKASEMLSWLQSILYRNGTTPMVNDSTEHIAVLPEDLFFYGKKLDLKWDQIPLSASGYRKIIDNTYEVFIDVGRVGAAYQSGHAHADTFSFELHYKNQPIIVDPGISTYENNSTRANERSTAYHNTVTVNGENSSEVWGGFRMGNRASVDLLIDEEKEISAIHDGYSKLGVWHKRTFKGEKETLTIEDEMKGDAAFAQSHFHFYPNSAVEVKDNIIMVNGVEVSFKNCKDLKLSSYDYAIGFNKTIPAKKVVIDFDQKLITTIKFST